MLFSNFIKETLGVLEKTPFGLGKKIRRLIEGINNNIVKVLNETNPDLIYIKDVPKYTINIENEKIFQDIVELFVQEQIKINPDYHLESTDITSNTKMYRMFLKFFFSELNFGEKIKIDPNPENRTNLDLAIFDFEVRYGFATKFITKYYDDFYRVYYKPKGYKKGDEEVEVEMLGYLKAYTMMKEGLNGQKRIRKDAAGNPERSFNHSQETMGIIINELPLTNRTKLIGALLHDAKEDIENYTYKLLYNEFGKDIADVVENLTKKDWWLYGENITLNPDEEDILEKMKNNSIFVENEYKDDIVFNNLKKKLKKIRNDEYFGKLEELDKDNAEKNTLYVKFADRIHNLRTLDEHSIDKQIEKIIETEKYFYIPAFNEKDRINNLDEVEKEKIMKGKYHAIDLMENEIIKLLSDKKILNAYMIKSDSIGHKCPMGNRSFEKQRINT